MILLAVLAIIHLPPAASIRSHLSESLKLKCEALPYRTTYADDRCYFAVAGEIEYRDAAAQCSSIVYGAKAAVDAPAAIFEAMMVDKSKFHSGSTTSGGKNLICYYANAYKCDPSETLTNGRCLVRAPKKMNFADAKKFCEDRGMALPAAANDFGNRIFRDALVNGPAWVDKSIVRVNGLKWTQGRSFSRWSTCNYTAGHQPRLYAGSQNALWYCNKDMASVIDRNGYWSNGGAEYLMDVVCAKNAVNAFTKVASLCNYHEANVQEFQPVTGVACGTVNSKTCYTPVQTTTRYEIHGKGTVETQRGCEVLCDSKPECTAFSFKDDGASSSCVLHSTPSSEVFSAPTRVFLKKTTGCVARTNLTAEFGVDPCIDQMVPSAFRGLGALKICQKNKAMQYFTRAIDACGRRITIDNNHWNWIAKAGDMWEMRYKYSDGWAAPVVPIVAASCVRAGGEKCPCQPLKHLKVTVKGDAPGWTHYPATPERVNPCKANAWLRWDVIRYPGHISHFKRLQTVPSFINCRAGMWMLWAEWDNMWGVSSVACYD